MNLNNFTIKSQDAVEQAIQLVSKCNQQSIEATHLLKAVLQTGEDMSRFLFQKLGVNLQVVNKELEIGRAHV